MSGRELRFDAGQQLPEYQVRAHNASIHSANKIHDDTVAKEYGFAGGLVPGVTVFAYMARPVVEAFGDDWLSRGRMDARFLRPFYEGETATIRASVREIDANGPVLELAALNDAGDTCATGSACWLAEGSPALDLAGFPETPLETPKPPASEAWFRAHPVLGTLHDIFRTGEPNDAYLAEVADDLPLWHGAGAPAHPGYLLRKANDSLSRNVELGPWIHVSSEVHYLGTVTDGDRLDTHGRVLDVFERKGHRFVDLDVLVVRNTEAPAMRAHHTAIYEPRRAG
jgi:acyl dehydratase